MSYILNYPLSTFNFLCSSSLFPIIPHSVRKKAPTFSDILPRTAHVHHPIPGVSLRSTPGYQDFATTWLNPSLELVLSMFPRFPVSILKSSVSKSPSLQVFPSSLSLRHPSPPSRPSHPRRPSLPRHSLTSPQS